jgi:hypothetical protein
MLLLAAALSPPILVGGEIGFPITARDGHGHVQTIRVGVHPEATYGFDKALGEMAIPPVPPIPVLDIRLEDPPGRTQHRFDGGWVDIRPLVSPAQTDTFFVRYQAAPDAFPVILSWDSTDFQAFERAIVIGTLTTGPIRLNLRASSSLTIPDGEFATLRIILTGPHAEALRKKP